MIGVSRVRTIIEFLTTKTAYRFGCLPIADGQINQKVFQLYVIVPFTCHRILASLMSSEQHIVSVSGFIKKSGADLDSIRTCAFNFSLLCWCKNTVSTGQVPPPTNKQSPKCVRLPPHRTQTMLATFLSSFFVTAFRHCLLNF
jgi:hypothetical protein